MAKAADGGVAFADVEGVTAVTVRRDETTVSGYAIVGEVPVEHAAFADALRQSFEQAGFVPASQPESAALVLNLVDFERPRPFRRKARGTYVAALAVRRLAPADGLRETYPLLVRALANIALCYLPTTNEVLFTTMERGHYAVSGDGDLPSLARAVVERLAPLARARLVIDNDFRTDLEPELWGGDEQTEEIAEAGRRLDELGLLPAPFPIEDLLDERDLRHVHRLYGIGGLSYGNLSARKDERRFWMSASGVDKSRLVQPGRDILLVSDYQRELSRIVVSIPPGIEPRRVSVDAIEHWMIYQQHPSVESILHVHAWMEGIPATELNFPCGTEELATSVAALLAAEPDPAQAVIGLRNHGITATGTSLGEILDRIEPRLLKLVPMT